jgi:hypothetical protein
LLVCRVLWRRRCVVRWRQVAVVRDVVQPTVADLRRPSGVPCDDAAKRDALRDVPGVPVAVMFGEPRQSP